MLEARNAVEEVYRLDLRKAFANKQDADAKKLVCSRLASGASFLRDLVYTAWMDERKTTARRLRNQDLPNSLENPPLQSGDRVSAVPPKK